MEVCSNDMEKIGLGGGCHWCTEAVFQSLKGVTKVQQGFISPAGEETSFSEAVIVHFDASQIALRDLVEIHLYTHKSAANHSMRYKYRSAVYAFDDKSLKDAEGIIDKLQPNFENQLITKVLYFGLFKASEKQFHNYYYNNPDKPFCETYISPKLSILLNKFSRFVDEESINSPHKWT